MERETALAQDLPQELLGEIFVRCLPDNVFCHFQPSSSLPPLVLCQVCSSWRKAALGTPQLWEELSMKLEYASSRSLGGGIMRKKFDTLQFWGSHMLALLPSLHLRRDLSRTFVTQAERRNWISFETFFQSPVVWNARSLTLLGFCNLDFRKLIPLQSISFNNLEYLSISYPTSSEFSATPLNLPTCFTVRRLHIECCTPVSFGHAVPTGFSWKRITHLSASLRIERKDLYAILAGCVNMTSCSLVLVCVQLSMLTMVDEDATPLTFHSNLRTLSVQGSAREFTVFFGHFVFPSLVALRLSCRGVDINLKNVHHALIATPALKEFHLHFMQPFDVDHILRQPPEPHLAGPLAKFASGLQILVIDRFFLSSSVPAIGQNIRSFLHSSWINDAWTSHSQMSVEFIFDEAHLSVDLNREIDDSKPLPFRASARCVPGGLWNWKPLNARELRDRWDDMLAFWYN